MMNKDNRNDKIRKIAKKGLTFSLCAVLAGGLAAGSFEGVNKLAGWSGATTVEAASNKDETTLTYAKSEKKDADASDSKSDTGKDTGSTAKGSLDVSEIVSEALPSIVSITTKSVQEVQNYFGMYGMYGYAPQQQEQEVEGSGSGIIVGENDSELLIATNNHVVEGATTLSVCFIGDDVVNAEQETENYVTSNGDLNIDGAVSAKIKGTDEDTDLAVIAVEKSDIPEETMNQIKIAQLGNSDDLIVGEQVVAIGNALGYGQTVTSGWVSALERTVQSDSNTYEDLIQTDAAINPGNSGGALLNMNGELIGINEAKYSSTQVEGMGFAIPISKAEPILQNLMNLTTRYKVSDDKAAYIGINMADVSADVSQNYGIPTGVCIMSVVDGSPAADAGFKKGDVITTFDGRSISNAKGLKETLTYYAAGETVDVTVQRADNGEYKEVTLTLTLGSAADMPQTSGSSNGTTNDGTGSSDQNDQGIQNPFGNR